MAIVRELAGPHEGINFLAADVQVLWDMADGKTYVMEIGAIYVRAHNESNGVMISLKQFQGVIEATMSMAEFDSKIKSGVIRIVGW